MYLCAIRVSFFDLWPCRRPGTQRQHGKLYLWQYSVHTPSAMDKNLNTDFTENTDLAFSLIFLVGKCFLDFYQDFRGFASAWALPFLCWLQSLSFSNLSWPSQREGISYSTLSKTSSANYFSQSLQPPLVLPRRGDAGYSGSVKDWLMQVTLVLSKTGWCWLLLLLINTDNQAATSQQQYSQWYLSLPFGGG